MRMRDETAQCITQQETSQHAQGAESCRTSCPAPWVLQAAEACLVWLRDADFRRLVEAQLPRSYPALLGETGEGSLAFLEISSVQLLPQLVRSWVLD